VKTAIFLHYERGVDTGALDPSQRVRLVPERRFDGSGVLRYLADDLETDARRPGVADDHRVRQHGDRHAGREAGPTVLDSVTSDYQRGKRDCLSRELSGLADRAR
jgi:hypothetical protein